MSIKYLSPGKLWQKFRPSGPFKRLLPLFILGWLIINSSALCFFLGMPVFGAFPTFMDKIHTFFLTLSGLPWARDWLLYWRWLPLILPVFIFFWLVWLRKPTIFTAGLLAVSGMVTGPANRYLIGDLLIFSAAFAVIFMVFIWIVQIVWKNWDRPAPLPEEKKNR